METALANEDYLREAMEFQEVVVFETAAAVRQANIQYDVGLIDFLSVNQILDGLVGAQSFLLTLENLRLANRVNLHLALGGDYGAPAPGQPVSGTDVGTDQLSKR